MLGFTSAREKIDIWSILFRVRSLSGEYARKVQREIELDLNF